MFHLLRYLDPPSPNQLKNRQSWTLSDKTFWIRACKPKFRPLVLLHTSALVYTGGFCAYAIAPKVHVLTKTKSIQMVKWTLSTVTSTLDVLESWSSVDLIDVLDSTSVTSSAPEWQYDWVVSYDNPFFSPMHFPIKLHTINQHGPLYILRSHRYL